MRAGVAVAEAALRRSAVHDVLVEPSMLSAPSLAVARTSTVMAEGGRVGAACGDKLCKLCPKRNKDKEKERQSKEGKEAEDQSTNSQVYARRLFITRSSILGSQLRLFRAHPPKEQIHVVT